MPRLARVDALGVLHHVMGRGIEGRKIFLNTKDLNSAIDIAGEKHYFVSMKRQCTAKYHMSERRNDDFVPGTPAYRLSLVWPLTREIASMSKKHDAERRLQRHVTRLIRREG